MNHLEMADELIAGFAPKLMCGGCKGANEYVFPNGCPSCDAGNYRMAEELMEQARAADEMTLMAHIGAVQEIVIWAEEEVKKAQAEKNPDKFANLAYSAWKIEAGARLLVTQLKVHLDLTQ